MKYYFTISFIILQFFTLEIFGQHRMTGICFFCGDYDTYLKKGHWIQNTKNNITLFSRPQKHRHNSSPDSTVISNILIEQVNCLKEINDKLKTDYHSPIRIYLYNFDEALRKIGTNGGGWSNGGKSKIYYTFNGQSCFDSERKVYEYIGVHELVHIVATNCVGVAKTRLMSEGYAVSIDGGFGVEETNSIRKRKLIISWMKEYAKTGQIKKPLELLTDSIMTEKQFYPQAGFFVDWLFKTYGVEKINKLYTVSKKEFVNKIEEITGDKFDTIESKYLLYCDEILKKNAR